MPFALSLLKASWKYLLVAIVVGGALWYVFDLRDTIRDQKVQIAQLESDKQTLLVNNQTLKDAISSTNVALLKLSEGIDETKQKFGELQTSVTNRTTIINNKLQQITAEPAPSSCTDTIQYLIDAAKGYPK